MAIYAKASGGGQEYTPAPAGAHAAVCCDVVDLGILEVTFGGKTKKQHKVNIFWQIAEDRDDGKPFMVRKRYTLSLHEKASLRKDLEAWRGRAFTPQELEGFDLEQLLGKPCMLSIIHAPKPDGGGTWANVAAIMKLGKGMAAISVRDYVRQQDREEAQPDGPPPPDIDTEGMGISDDDIPF